ncbi:MAG: hypothetical protein KKD44_26095 [Proteobacteria bacterium]|nr:hypothetical protein [Pseudomonadota bacterium]
MSFHDGMMAPVPQLLSAVHSGVAPTPAAAAIEDGWLPRIRLPRTPVQLDARVQIHIRQRIVTTVQTTIHTTQRIATEIWPSVTVWGKYIYEILYEAKAVTQGDIIPNAKLDRLTEEIRNLKFMVADMFHEMLKRNKT